MKENYGIQVLVRRIEEVTESIEKMESMQTNSLDQEGDNLDIITLKTMRAEIYQVLLKYLWLNNDLQDPVTIYYHRNTGDYVKSGHISARTGLGVVIRTDDFNEHYIPYNKITKLLKDGQTRSNQKDGFNSIRDGEDDRSLEQGKRIA
jgi:hypothetical protein